MHHYYIIFGILFLSSFIASLTLMLVFFGPRKYMNGLTSKKRVVSTLFFFGLTALTVLLAFVTTNYYLILFSFIFQQIAWGFNFAAGFGITPCALP